MTSPPQREPLRDPVHTTTSGPASAPRSTRLALLLVGVVVILLLGTLSLSRSCDINERGGGGGGVTATPPPSSIPRSSEESRRSEVQDREQRFWQSIRKQGAKPNPPLGVVSDATDYLPPLPGSCPFPIGNTQCISHNRDNTDGRNSSDKKGGGRTGSSATRSSSSSWCCTCCWRPHPRSCVGSFENTSEFVINFQVRKTGFFATPQGWPAKRAAAAACPWWDRGFWSKPLPANFLDLPESEAAAAVDATCGISEQRAAAASSSSSPMKKRRTVARRGTGNDIGPMYMRKLARRMRELRPTHPNMTFYRNAPGGVLVLSGDSITRQLFSRMVHNIRSRECSDEAEMRRRAVFELQIHETAAYVATSLGDAFVLANSCESGLEYLKNTLNKVLPPSSSSSYAGGGGDAAGGSAEEESAAGGGKRDVAGGGERRTSFRTTRSASSLRHRVFLEACFVWDNTPSAHLGTVENLHKVGMRVAALVFFPQIWFCGTHTPACINANQSNGAALTVIGTAVHFGIPRIVICNNVVRQHFAYFNVERVKQRNEQLRELFPVSTRLPWVRAMAPKGTWSTVRLYDFSRRHDILAPEQCDVVHGMCMFLPARAMDKVTAVTGLFGRLMCPGLNGTCQDMGNFVLLRELFVALLEL